ncbi:MAG: acetolactate decarboxylase [Candidatus Bathyarchaeota archaeon]|nr:acetolactate decarboxylase [Candidatus Bathyarchaeota archaeon]
MKTKTKWLLSTAAILFILISAFYVAWQNQASASSAPEKDMLFQLSAFNTFSAGKYSGFMNYSDLAQHGDFGIGTFDSLDGEMLALDGVFYQIPHSGVPRQADPAQTAPYATITYFDVDQTYTLSGVNYTGLKAFLDEKLTDKDAIYALKVSGDYSFVQARSPQKQNEPYPDLTGALKDQAVFNFTSVKATAVGFWFPQCMDGVDYVGYHLHVITADHAAGGHLLDCVIENASVEVDIIKSYQLILPPATA